MHTAAIQLTTADGMLVSILRKTEEREIERPVELRFKFNFDVCPFTGFQPATELLHGLVQDRVSILLIDGLRVSVDRTEIERAFGHIIGERQSDELPCSACGDYRGILVLKCGYNTFDVCNECAQRLALKW